MSNKIEPPQVIKSWKQGANTIVSLIPAFKEASRSNRPFIAMLYMKFWKATAVDDWVKAFMVVANHEWADAGREENLYVQVVCKENAPTTADIFIASDRATLLEGMKARFPDWDSIQISSSIL